MIRRTRSGSISSSYVTSSSSLLNESGNTYEDRVVRARTAPDTTMPEQRSRKVFTWVSMSKGNSCTMCAVMPP